MLGGGEDFHTGAMFEIHPFPFRSKCIKGLHVKRAVSQSKLMLVFSLLIFTSRFVDQSHARLFVEIYIRACKKLTIFSKYARAHWRTGSSTPLFSHQLLAMFISTVLYLELKTWNNINNGIIEITTLNAFKRTISEIEIDLE